MSVINLTVKSVAQFFMWAYIRAQIDETHNMPHGRRKDKRMIGAWFTPDEIKRIDDICRALGISRAELLRRIAEGQLIMLRKP